MTVFGGQGAVHVPELSISSKQTPPSNLLPLRLHDGHLVLHVARLPHPDSAVAGDGQTEAQGGDLDWGGGAGVDNTQPLLDEIHLSLVLNPQTLQLLLLLEKHEVPLLPLPLCSHLNLSFKSSFNLSFNQMRKLLMKKIRVINSAL